MKQSTIRTPFRHYRNITKDLLYKFAVKTLKQKRINRLFFPTTKYMYRPMNNQLPIIRKITEILVHKCAIMLQFIRAWVWCETSHLVLIDECIYLLHYLRCLSQISWKCIDTEKRFIFLLSSLLVYPSHVSFLVSACLQVCSFFLAMRILFETSKYTRTFYQH